MEAAYKADDIKVISAREAVRLRPRLHFEESFTSGNLNALPFEMLCHAFDEYLDGQCTRITIVTGTDFVELAYNAGMSLQIGAGGIPKAVSIMTELMACRHEKKHLEVGAAYCRLGMATINYVAESCVLKTVHQGRKAVFVYEKGLPISENYTDATGEQEATTLLFRPDKSIFGELAFDFAGIHHKADEVMQQLTALQIIVRKA